SAMATKTEAASVLRSFGAEKVMMLDGGSSTQLTCRGENYVSSGRRIPQSIAVMAAVPEAAPYISRQTPSFLP
ncbi:MAG TPA: phosphodiester glycosidase family protein, partial [Anaerolineae bacterium]